MKLSMAEQAEEKGVSSFRGHKIILLDGKWVYEDNGKPLPCDGGELRPCKKCGSCMWSGDGNADECLGILPGVTNACCGHGDTDKSYIVFDSGVVIRGFSIVDGRNKMNSLEIKMETIHMTEEQFNESVEPNEFLLAAGKRYNDAVLSGTGVTIAGKHLPLKDFMVTADEEPDPKHHMTDLEIVQMALEDACLYLAVENGESHLFDDVGQPVISSISNSALLAWAKQTLGIEG